MKHRILIIDDEMSICVSLTLALQEEYDVQSAITAEEGVELLEAGAFQLVLLDLMIGEDDGMELLKRIKMFDKSIQVIVITAFGSVRSSVSAMRSGAFTYLTKPIDLEELKIFIYQALQYQDMHHKLLALNSELRQKYENCGMQGKSPQMQRVYKLIDKFKDTQASVIVTGESGTGKELVVRALHSGGVRKNEEFVEINCAAIPEGLLEDEFFGHVKGAFTGAFQDKVGKFALADRGTLFLDEIGDMPLSLQGKLLRVLQQREFTPIGSNKVRHVDVRVIAATNRDLYEMVENGTFRQDLFYRLHVMEIQVPPLRSRKEDIPLLCNYYLQEYCREHQHPPIEITSQALCSLLNYDFPGNVRQLFNFLEYSALVCDNSAITLADLSPELQDVQKNISAKRADKASLSDLLVGLPIKELERLAILGTLKKNIGKKGITAFELGISERNLRNKLHEYGQE